MGIHSVVSFYDSPVFKGNRFVYERKRRVIVQTL